MTRPAEATEGLIAASIAVSTSRAITVPLARNARVSAGASDTRSSIVIPPFAARERIIGLAAAFITDRRGSLQAAGRKIVSSRTQFALRLRAVENRRMTVPTVLDRIAEIAWGLVATLAPRLIFALIILAAGALIAKWT